MPKHNCFHLGFTRESVSWLDQVQDTVYTHTNRVPGVPGGLQSSRSINEECLSNYKRIYCIGPEINSNKKL